MNEHDDQTDEETRAFVARLFARALSPSALNTPEPDPGSVNDDPAAGQPHPNADPLAIFKTHPKDY